MANLLRKAKEVGLTKPAEWLAKKGVHPNTITLAGLILNIAAIVLQSLERARSREDRRIWVFWAATVMRLLALFFDGLDGSVAAAHKRINSKFYNPNGQLIDGGVDRVSSIGLMLMEQQRSISEGNYREANTIAAGSVLSGLSSLLRALVEAHGGTTQEQSLNPATFAGTHLGRTLVQLLATLEYEQYEQPASAAGYELTVTQHASIRESLHTYLTASNGIVVTERSGDLVHAVQNQTSAEETIDSAGRTKSLKDHWTRAKLYGALTGAAAVAGLAVGLNSRKAA